MMTLPLNTHFETRLNEGDGHDSTQIAWRASDIGDFLGGERRTSR
jgi:hypothetical protein